MVPYDDHYGTALAFTARAAVWGVLLRRTVMTVSRVCWAASEMAKLARTIETQTALLNETAMCKEVRVRRFHGQAWRAALAHGVVVCVWRHRRSIGWMRMPRFTS